MLTLSNVDKFIIIFLISRLLMLED